MDQTNTWGWVVGIIVALGVLGVIWWWASYPMTPGVPSTGTQVQVGGMSTSTGY